MKKMIMIFILFAVCSCRMSYPFFGEVLVFRRELLPVLSDCYLLLKPQGNYEIYFKSKDGISEMGKWERQNDTLILKLEVTYDYASDSLFFASDWKQVYVIERNCLKDVTCYAPVGEIGGRKLYDEINLNYNLIRYNVKCNLLKLIPKSE